MLMPKRVKYRKQHRGRRAGNAMRGNTISFGEFALVSMAAGWITSRQIEAARIAMTRHIKRGGKVWIRIFPDKPITKKPLETRMGKGKGPVEGWVAVVKPGRVMFEMNGVDVATAKEAMRLAMHKLPIKTKFVTTKDWAVSPHLGKSNGVAAAAPMAEAIDAPTEVEVVIEAPEAVEATAEEATE